MSGVHTGWKCNIFDCTIEKVNCERLTAYASGKTFNTLLCTVYRYRIASMEVMNYPTHAAPERYLEDDKVVAVLTLPAGHSFGIQFSETVPCEIRLIDEDSPIFEESFKCLGHLLFRLSVPNKVDIQGQIDSTILENFLKMYSNTPNRILMFKKRSEPSNEGLVTTITLPTGPFIGAKFQCSKTFFARQHRVKVEKVTPQICEIPIGHFVEQVIVPNPILIENVNSMEKMQSLHRFSEVPGRT